MNVNDLPRKQVALEWDGAWFCESCWKAHHWKEKAYIIDNRHYCRECAERALERP